jgi:hypothetical protein
MALTCSLWRRRDSNPWPPACKIARAKRPADQGVCRSGASGAGDIRVSCRGVAPTRRAVCPPPVNGSPGAAQSGRGVPRMGSGACRARCSLAAAPTTRSRRSNRIPAALGVSPVGHDGGGRVLGEPTISNETTKCGWSVRSRRHSPPSLRTDSGGSARPAACGRAPADASFTRSPGSPRTGGRRRWRRR